VNERVQGIFGMITTG